MLNAQQVMIVVSSILSMLTCKLANADENLLLPPVKITGNYDNAVGSSDAASQGAVNSTLLNTRPALRVGELLEFVPGVIVSQHSGDGKANQYYLRGFNLDHGTDFATFVDDIPVNMRTHAHGQGYTDLNFLIPELVDHIDYKKGPYFAEEGDFSSAGAARIRLSNQLAQGLASISIGSYGYQRAVLANSFDAENGTLLYGLEVNRNDGPWGNAENIKKFSGVLRYSVDDANDRYNLTAMAYRNQWDATDQIPLRAVTSRQIDRFGAIDQTDGGESSRYSVSFARHKRGKESAFDFNAYVVQSTLDLYSNFTYFLNNPVDGDQFNQNEHRKMAGFNIANTWYANLYGIDMQTKIGLQTRYDDLSPVALYNTVARQRTTLIRSDEVKELSTGVYAENSSQWLEKFRTVLGLRYDNYHFDIDSSIQDNSGKAHDGITSPKLSLIFGPWDKTEYFINYGSGFHSNDARGTTQTQLPSGGSTTPVTPLVSTRGSEIGFRTEIIPRLQSSLALWQLNIDSELLFVGDAGETEASRASRRHGVEWNNHYVANDWLLFDLDLAFSNAKYTDHDPVGSHTPGSVNRVISFGTTVTNKGSWSGAFQIRHFGPRPLIEDDSVKSHSTTIAYARLGYKFDQKTKLTLDIFNLFDRKASDIDYFYTSRLNGESLTGVDDLHYHPVEPRSARLTLTYNF